MWHGIEDTGICRGSGRDSGCVCASLFCRTVYTGAGCSHLATCQTLAACARLLNLQNQNNTFNITLSINYSVSMLILKKESDSRIATAMVFEEMN